MDAQPSASPLYRSTRIAPHDAPMSHVITSLNVVREVCPPGDEYRHQALGALTLFLTEQGEAEAEAGGQILPHSPGSLVLLNAGLSLRERVSPAQSWKVGYIMLAGPWAEALGGLLDERGRGCAMYQPAPLPWQRQFEELLDIGFTQGSGWQWAFLSGCAALFGWIERCPPAEEGADRLLDEVERLLDADTRRAWAVEELAGALGMTARQFGYRFSKATGRAPALWLRERRVQSARRLLGEGRSVSATADALGFANPYHFSRLFKAVAGVPPSSLRFRPASALHAAALTVSSRATPSGKGTSERGHSQDEENRRK